MSQAVGRSLGKWSPPNFPPGDPLEGRFCRLVRLDPEEHTRDLFEANSLDSRGLNWTYLPYGPFHSLDDFSSWLTGVTTKSDPLFYAIVDQRTGRAVGVASYLRITPASGVIEVGHLNFSPRLQRTTAATEAMYLMMAHAFDLGYRRYEWKCDSLNASSCSAAKRLGFQFEGIFRQATVYKGRNRDTAWYSVIDSEWPALRDSFTRWLSPENFDEQGNQRSSLKAIPAD